MEIDSREATTNNDETTHDDNFNSNVSNSEVTNSFNESITPTENISESTPKRKRGRPKKEDSRHVEPTEPRLNPDRAARHRRSEISEFADDDELLPSTSTDEPNSSSKKSSRKRAHPKRKPNEPSRPRGRPKKIVKKPICIVRPMPQTGNENKPRKCAWNNCTHTANSVRSLKSHVEREHLNMLTQYICCWDSCSRSNPFKALYMLSLHLRSHIGEKPYECRICGKTYTRQENLKTHQRAHNNERPFRCSVCQKGFTSASDKAKHQNRTHSQSKAYKCPVERCNKDYTDPSSLRKHIKKMHGGDIYTQAKQNKQRIGPGNNYGVIPSNIPPQQSPEPQPSTSREAA